MKPFLRFVRMPCGQAVLFVTYVMRGDLILQRDIPIEPRTGRKTLKTYQAACERFEKRNNMKWKV